MWPGQGGTGWCEERGGGGKRLDGEGEGLRGCKCVELSGVGVGRRLGMRAALIP